MAAFSFLNSLSITGIMDFRGRLRFLVHLCGNLVCEHGLIRNQSYSIGTETADVARKSTNL